MKPVELVCAGDGAEECKFRTVSMDKLRDHTRNKHNREQRFPNLLQERQP